MVVKNSAMILLFKEIKILLMLTQQNKHQAFLKATEEFSWLCCIFIASWK